MFKELNEKVGKVFEPRVTITKGSYGSVAVSDGNVDFVENTLIPEKSRMSPGLDTGFGISNTTSRISAGSIGEYQNCCGKAILHNMFLAAVIKPENGGNVRMVTAEEGKTIWMASMDLVKAIAKKRGYGALSIVVSEFEQPGISKAMEGDYTPVNTFINPRNNHVCRNYEILL